MPKKTQEPVIVARYGDKVTGWIGAETGGRFYGDTEWVAAAQSAAVAGLEFTLYEDIELIAGNDTPTGAFAALAWYAKERIRVIEAPEGMMESLGLLDTPVEIDALEDETAETADGDAGQLFRETHVRVIVDGVSQWVPLAELTGKAPAMDATLVRMISERLEAERQQPAE